MNTRDINVLIAAMRAEGITLAAAAGGKLRIEVPDGAVAPELRDAFWAVVAARRCEILAVLTGRPVPVADGIVADAPAGASASPTRPGSPRWSCTRSWRWSG